MGFRTCKIAKICPYEVTRCDKVTFPNAKMFAGSLGTLHDLNASQHIEDRYFNDRETRITLHGELYSQDVANLIAFRNRPRRAKSLTNFVPIDNDFVRFQNGTNF